MSISIEKARELLNNAAPSFAMFKEKDASNNGEWQREIELLESRVKTAHADVDLGDGHTIAVRLCLLESEAKRLAEIDRINADETDPDKQMERVCEKIEIMTANPRITKEWLLANQNRYSPADLLSVMMGYMEVRLREQERHMRNLQSAAAFRTVESGAKLR